MTEPVTNQPYKAKIRIFIISRAINYSETSTNEMVDRVLSSCEAALKLHKYGTQKISIGALETAMERIEDQAIRALVKDEHIEIMQNEMLPSCYAVDRLEASAHDLSSIVNSLIEHPYCAVSFQLTPTRFTF